MSKSPKAAEGKSPKPADPAAVSAIAELVEATYPNRLTREEAERLAKAAVLRLRKKGFKLKQKEKQKAKAS